jgi:hypothetical protein
MPGPNLNQPLLDGQANYVAEDWARASASGKLNLLAAAELRRGLNLGIGAEALVDISGSLRKFLAADVSGQANASARVQAQVQVPLDLFSEAGLAVRLQAVAEAAAGVSLGIGLSVGDFLTMANADPRMQGAPLKLLGLLLEPNQVVLSAGVKAKAAASAMAYVNFLVTGSLTGAKPGFLVAAEAGLGLEAGGGYQVFVNFGLASPHRFLRRSIDIAVDETLRLISAQVTDPTARRVVSELRMPAKTAFRAAFELGWALAEGGGAFNAGAGPQLAQRIAIVILEEGQRSILEALTSFAIDQFQRLIFQAGIAQANWDATLALRTRLADRFRQMPDDPFEATPANRDHWLDIIGDMVQLGVALSAAAAPGANTFSAILWSALQLLFRGTERISNFQVRGSIVGVGANTRTVAFNQALPQQPPPELRRIINTSLGRSPNDTLTESHLVDFLVRDAVLNPLLQAAPNLKAVLDVVFGPSAGAGIAAAKVVLREAGAFVPGANGTISSEATLRVLLDGLQAYIDTRLQQEVLPLIRPALAGNRDLELYLDEVLLPSVDFSLQLLAERVLSWSQGGRLDQTTLREACSGVLMKLIGRSLVVSLDIVLTASLAQMQREFRNAAAHVNDNRGIAQGLASATGLDRAFLAEVLEETLSICAETFGPFPDERRAHIRSLLFQLVDVLPGRDREAFVAQLKDDFFVPNLDAGIELAQVSGGLIADSLGRFITALLDRVGALILQELQEALQALQAAVDHWLQELERLVDELFAALRELERQIRQLVDEVEAAWNRAFDGLETLLSGIGGSGRSSVRGKVKSALVARAIEALEGNDVYAALPREAKTFARDRLRDVVNGVLDNELFNDVWDAMAAVSSEAAELMEDIRDLDLDSDLVGQISDLLLDRIEDVLHDMFGGRSPKIPIAIPIHIDLGIARIDESINLGSVKLPLGQLIDAVRDGVADLSLVESSIRSIAGSVLAALEAAGRLAAAEDSKDTTEDEHRRVKGELDSSRRSDFDIEILSPTAAGAYDTSTVELEIFLENVPISYLGLGELEQQRVSVFLNRDELDLDTFTVEEYRQPPTEAPPPLRLGGRVEVGTRDGSDLRPFAGNTPTSRAPILRFQPGTPVGPWGQTVLLEPEGTRVPRQRLQHFRSGQGKTVPPAEHVRERAVFMARSKKGDRRASPVPTAGANGRANGRLGRGIGAATRDPLAGRKRETLASEGSRPSLGRTLTVRGRLARLETLGSGLLLRLVLPASRFVEGINTLTVALVPGRGPRLERVVSFAVLAAVPVSRPKIPPPRDKTADLPLPTSIRGFAHLPGDAPAMKPGKPAPAPAAGRPQKPSRTAKIKDALERQQHRSQKTAAALSKRVDLVRERTRPAGEAQQGRGAQVKPAKPRDQRPMS